MRVVVIGGVPKSLVNFRGQLLSAMVRAGNEVIACAPGHPDYIVEELMHMGVFYRDVPIHRTGMNPLRDINTILSLKNLLHMLHPDCCLFYTIKPVIYGSIAAKLARIPHIFSMITGLGYSFGSVSISQRAVGFMVRQLYKHALSHNSAVFFQNPDDQQYFIKTGLIQGHTKSVLINGSGVDLQYYYEAPLNTNRIVFLLIARLIRDKGIYEYVEAARIIKRKYPNTMFKLLGPFDTNPSAIKKNTIDHWQGEGVIDYLGETRDVRPYIADSNVYVLPSYREGTPRTVLEAMAMGRPVITTDAPGCKETVMDGYNGFRVPVKNIELLAGAMERFIKNPDLIERMGKASRRLAVEKYDVHIVNRTIIATMGLS